MGARRFSTRWCIGSLVAVAAAGAAWAEDGEKKPLPKVHVAHVVLKGELAESADAPGLFGELSENLGQFMNRLDRAAKDKEVAAVLLHIDGPTLGRGKAHELRQAIAQFRASGKKIYAYAGSLSGSEYVVASACDLVVLPPSGSLAIPGVRAEISFYKGLLEKVGIQADFLQMGKYKGAAEPYTRTGLSEASREQWNAILDDAYASLIGQIAESRRLEAAQVKELVDVGLFTAQAAQAAGLVDRVAYEDEFRKSLAGALGAAEVAVKEKYGKKKLDTDFSGFGGMMKMMNLLLGVDAGAGKSGKPKIAVIYAAGPIVDGDGGGSLFGGGEMVSSRSMVSTLQKAAADKDVKAIVLRVDSPGGSALASDLIWREVTRIDKPVIASMGDVAASGGYYISMAADQIFAEPDTITGSIGVIGGKLATKGLMDKLGVTTEILARGKNSGLFSGHEPFSDTERAAWTASMTATYQQFVQKAAEGRKLPPEKLEALAQGRVWTGRQAQERGLVDKLGTLADAIAEARSRAGLKPEEDVEIQRLPKPKSFFDTLLGEDVEVRLGPSLKSVDPDLRRLLHQAEIWRRLGDARVLTILPYDVRLQ